MDINLLELIGAKNPSTKHKFVCSEANNSYYEVLFYYDQLKENNSFLNPNIITFRNNPDLKTALKESSKTLDALLNKKLISSKKHKMYESKLKKSGINIYTVPEAKKELKRALDSKNKTNIKDINNSLFKAYINFINS